MQSRESTRVMRMARAHLIYVSLMAATSVLGLLKTVVFAAQLGTLEFGYYSLALLTSAYVSYALGLGLKEGVLREGGILFGKGDRTRLGELTGEAIVLAGAVGATLGAAMTLAVWHWLPVGEAARHAIALAIVLSFSLVEFNLICNDLRVRQDLNGFASALLARNVLALAGGSFLAMSHGFEGVVLAEAASGGVVFVAVALVRRGNFQLARPRSNTMLPVVRVGFALSGNNLVRSLSLNVDRWLVAFALGAEALGQYSFALITLTVGMAIVNILAQALGPKWISQYGSHEDLSEIKMEIDATVRKLAFAALLAGAFVALAAPSLIAVFLPEYELAAGLVPIIYCGVVFYLCNLYDWVAVAAGRGGLLIKISTVVVALLVVMDTIVLRFAWGLIGFAIAFALARAADFLLNWRASRMLVSYVRDPMNLVRR